MATDSDREESGLSDGVTKVEKPWGHELLWAITDRYVGKIIHVKAGHALSLQFHERKDETILVWSGRIAFDLKRDDRMVQKEMLPGDRIHVPAGTVHRITAIDDSDVIEVSTPELDDVVRLEDNYGRADPLHRSK